jgi:phage recombination protein Bet
MNNKLTLQTDKLTYTKEQVDLIKKTVAVGATDAELQLFLYQAQRTGLDALARQIYFVKRGYGDKAKVVIQTSIDGFRVIAQRSQDYAGQAEPEFTDNDAPHPKICKVRVYKFSPKGDRYEAAVGVAYWDEYCPTPGQDFMWKKMPHTMLSKVAEALALRKAFPQDLSGIYTDDEMAQADKNNTPLPQPVVQSVTESDGSQVRQINEDVIEAEPIVEITPVIDEKVTMDEVKRILHLAKQKGKNDIDLSKAIAIFKKEALIELTMKQAESLIKRLESMPDAEELKIDLDEIDKEINK